jgi:hypothetical protein
MRDGADEAARQAERFRDVAMRYLT